MLLRKATFPDAAIDPLAFSTTVGQKDLFCYVDAGLEHISVSNP